MRTRINGVSVEKMSEVIRRAGDDRVVHGEQLGDFAGAEKAGVFVTQECGKIPSKA